MGKFGQPPRKNWHSTQELGRTFNSLNKKLNQLMVLDFVWDRLVGVRGEFWQLEGVKEGTLYVKVTASVAKNQLLLQRDTLIRELNKHFEHPWIQKIEIL